MRRRKRVGRAIAMSKNARETRTRNPWSSVHPRELIVMKGTSSCSRDKCDYVWWLARRRPGFPSEARHTAKSSAKRREESSSQHPDSVSCRARGRLAMHSARRHNLVGAACVDRDGPDLRPSPFAAASMAGVPKPSSLPLARARLDSCRTTRPRTPSSRNPARWLASRSSAA